MLFLSTLQEFDKLAATLDKEKLEKFANEILSQIGYDKSDPKQFVQEKIAAISPKMVGAINDSIDLGQVYYLRVVRPKINQKKEDKTKKGDSIGRSNK